MGLIACIYILILVFLTENRIAQMVTSQAASQLMGYKALNLSSSRHDGYLDFVSSRPLEINPLSSRGTADSSCLSPREDAAAALISRESAIAALISRETAGTADSLTEP